MRPDQTIRRPHGELGTANADDVAPPEAFDASRQIVGGVVGVRIHARHVLAASLVQADVQTTRRGPAGVVEHADADIVAGQPRERLARSVSRAAVEEDQLPASVQPLPEHGRRRLIDEGRLIEDRNQEADQIGVALRVPTHAAADCTAQARR